MSSNNGPDRRQLLKIFTIGGVATTVLLPATWTKPIVRAVFVPAHAAASPSSIWQRSHDHSHDHTGAGPRADNNDTGNDAGNDPTTTPERHRQRRRQRHGNDDGNAPRQRRRQPPRQRRTTTTPATTTPGDVPHDADNDTDTINDNIVSTTDLTPGLRRGQVWPRSPALVWNASRQLVVTPGAWQAPRISRGEVARRPSSAMTEPP